MKALLGNVSEIHTPKVNPNFRRIATPPPEPYTLFDDFDLIEDQLLFSTTNAFSDKDAGMFRFASIICSVMDGVMNVFYFFLFFSSDRSILEYPFSGNGLTLFQ